MGELANIVRGASPRPIQDPKWFDKDSDIGWLRISDVTEQNGRIHHLEQRISKLGQEKTRVLKGPHLLLSIAATVGKPLVNYVKTGVHDGFLIFLNPSFEREFMFQWLEMFRPKWQKYGQPGSQVNLNSELVRNQEVPMPSIEEQQKIGNFFKQLDETITLHQRKLDKLKQLKQGYLQQLFPQNGKNTPRIRFAHFENKWEQDKFGNLIKEKREKTKIENEDTLLSCAIDGIYLNSELFDHFRGTSNIGYLKIKMNDMILSAQNLHLGNANINLRFEHGMISPAYKVYNLTKADPHFMSAWLKAKSTKNFFERATTEGASVCRKNILWNDLYKQDLFVPSFTEQEKIGSFFKQLDDTITIHQSKLDKLNLLKQALLQKIFV